MPARPNRPGGGGGPCRPLYSHLAPGHIHRPQWGGLQHFPGQKQLLTIARAILADPAILILDEATSNVDTRTRNPHSTGDGKINAGPDQLCHCSSPFHHSATPIWILVMNEGRIVEQGTHAELLGKKILCRFIYQPVRRFPPARGGMMPRCRGCFFGHLGPAGRNFN